LGYKSFTLGNEVRSYQGNEGAVEIWLGRQDSNLGMAESKSAGRH